MYNLSVMKSSKKVNQGVQIVGGVALALLVLVMNVVSPDVASPVLLMGIFALIYLVSFAMVYLLGSFFLKIRDLSHGDLPKKPSSFSQKRLTYTAVVSSAPVFLFAIQSIKMVGWYELLLVGLAITLGCFVIYRG